MPACTILPITKKVTCQPVSLSSKQSNMVEQLPGFNCMSMALGAQVNPPTNPTKKYTAAVSPYPNSKSLQLFFKLIFFFKMGAAVGCNRNDKANAPATLEKSLSNNSNSPKWMLPSMRNLMTLIMIQMLQTMTQYIEYLSNLRIRSKLDLQRVAIHRHELMMQAHCMEYTSKLIFYLGLSMCLICCRIAKVIWNKLVAISKQYAMQTKKSTSMLTTLFIALSFTPPILRMDTLKVPSSVLLWMTSNRQVRNWMHPTANMIRLEPMMPSLRNRTGYTMTAEPIMVFVIVKTVFVEVSVPVSFELLSTFTLSIFYCQEINRVFLMAQISAQMTVSSSGTFMDSYYLILMLQQSHHCISKYC